MMEMTGRVEGSMINMAEVCGGQHDGDDRACGGQHDAHDRACGGHHDVHDRECGGQHDEHVTLRGVE